MNKELILKAVNLVFEFNEKFFGGYDCPKYTACIEINAKTLRLSVHNGNGWSYFENSGWGPQITNEENLNNFINLLTELMEGSK